MNTNTGTQTLEWLYTDQLKVDEEWSQKTASGFRWWADNKFGVRVRCQSMTVISIRCTANQELLFTKQLKKE